MSSGLPAQRIARLTPISEVLTRINALVAPVAPHAAVPRAAIGRVLAEDAVAPAGMPAVARALRDGFAVRADTITDASPYAPVPLAAARRVDVGDPIPPDTDAVVALDAVATNDDDRHHVVGPLAGGEGVLAIDADVRPGEILRRAGERLTACGAAVLAAVGVAQVKVRVPRIRLVQTRAEGDPLLEAACDLIAQAVAAMGAQVRLIGIPAETADLEAALADSAADAVIAFGGTGPGRHDVSVHKLARVGRVVAHGFALSPGETAAIGLVQARPVLLLPGRIDAALAAWLTLGRPLLARLANCSEQPPVTRATLSRKVTSPLGLADVIAVRLRDGEAEPLASGYWPLAAIVQADGWILVPPGSEGYPAGSAVVVRALP